jgi:phenylacetyl-CoA:acceptor oxidoreductase subunit 2
MIRFATKLQTHWDWRAAGNFVFGGAGSGLLALLGAAVLTGASPHPRTVLPALALIGAGLACVWLEIGRPWRALNVFRHAQRSWMTREGMVAALAMPAGLAAALSGQPALLVAAGVLGLAFLYCQARILRAAKGVPAWREPAVVPLIVATGLAEGAGVLALLGGAGVAVPAWLGLALAVLALLRALAWRRYRAGLQRAQAPAAAQARLARFDPWLGRGGLVVAVLAVGAALAPSPAGRALLVLAGLAGIGAGWAMKAALVTRAAQLQGYAFGHLRRGHPLAHSPANPSARTTR